jgi:hypothetical protein
MALSLRRIPFIGNAVMEREWAMVNGETANVRREKGITNACKQITHQP